MTDDITYTGIIERLRHLEDRLRAMEEKQAEQDKRLKECMENLSGASELIDTQTNEVLAVLESNHKEMAGKLNEILREVKPFEYEESDEPAPRAGQEQEKQLTAKELLDEYLHGEKGGGVIYE